MTVPDFVRSSGLNLVQGAIGSLVADEWAYGDQDALGFNTIYVNIGVDPTGADLRAVAGESDERVAEEAADVLYHLQVALSSREVPLSAPLEVLNRRRK